MHQAMRSQPARRGTALRRPRVFLLAALAAGLLLLLSPAAEGGHAHGALRASVAHEDRR